MASDEQEHREKARLLVASNRGPVTVEAVEGGEDEVRRGGGGLVSGMQTALAASEGAVWVCSALSDRERTLARSAQGRPLSAVGVDTGDLEVRMLPIDAMTFRRAYNGIANSTLWYLAHMLYEPARSPVFDSAWGRQWLAYERYNRQFAEALAQDAADGATVMVQDYHLFLVPDMLRQLRPDVRIGHFTHTPFAPALYFGMLPDGVARSLLTGMLGADILGFHDPRWVRDFQDCCASVLDARIDGDAVVVDGRRVECRVFPLGVDAGELEDRSRRRDAIARHGYLSSLVGDCAVITRVDRTELSKNILRGLLAYREFLRMYPDWQGRVVHLAFAYPSRYDLPEYREYASAVERLGREIEDEFGTDDWSPLHLQIADDLPGSLAAMRMADVLLINPIRDGMNLVVKEGLVLSERDAVAVLSRMAGAAPELGADALLVNPYDVTETAQAIHRALTMDPAERAARAERQRAAASKGNPVLWFRDQIEAVERVPVRTGRPAAGG
jgi:trehalose 6-phosphate synthase